MLKPWQGTWLWNRTGRSHRPPKVDFRWPAPQCRHGSPVAAPAFPQNRHLFLAEWPPADTNVRPFYLRHADDRAIPRPRPMPVASEGPCIAVPLKESPSRFPSPARRNRIPEHRAGLPRAPALEACYRPAVPRSACAPVLLEHCLPAGAGLLQWRQITGIMPPTAPCAGTSSTPNRARNTGRF
jgi:hypothetical protein